MSELLLRRQMAETPAFFDLQRAIWRRNMRALCPQQKRDDLGRFTNQGNQA